MNKKELIASVAEKTGLSKKDIEAAFTQIFETIKDALAGQDKIAIKGFGTFTVKSRAAKTGRHPKTGQELQIPARNVPVFSAGSELKDVVANPKKAKKAAAPKAASTKKGEEKKAPKADKPKAPKAEKAAAPAPKADKPAPAPAPAPKADKPKAPKAEKPAAAPKAEKPAAPKKK